MKKVMLALVLVSLIPVFIVAGVLLVDWEEAEEEPEEILGNLYTFSLSVGEETYIVTVRSNYSSAPEVSYSSYPQFSSCYVSVDFRGDPENSFCNITIPTDLIWGSISVIDKYYEMSADRYTLFSNGTHNSVYFLFNYTALVKHFEIRGTEGVIAETPYSSSEPSFQPRIDNQTLFFENGTESKLYLVRSSLNYESSEEELTIPIKGRTLNIGDSVVVINGEIINNYDKAYYFAISGDLFTSDGEKLEGADYIMNEPVGNFVLLHVPSLQQGTFKLLFKYDEKDVERYNLFLIIEPLDSPPP